MTSQGVGHSSFLFIYNLRVKSTCSARSLQTENSRKWVPKGYSIRGYVSTFFAIFSLMKMGCTQLCKCHLCSKEKLCLPKPKGLLLIASWCIDRPGNQEEWDARKRIECSRNSFASLIKYYTLSISWKPWMCMPRSSMY